MSLLKIIKLEPNLISHIYKNSDKIKFSTEAHLFYEGQIPIVAYLIIEGNIQLQKKKKIKHTLSTGCVVGIEELIKNLPSKLSAKVLADSVICFIDKSTLKEILKDPQSGLKELFLGQNEVVE